MVANAQETNYGTERGGPRAAGGGRAGNPRPHQSNTRFLETDADRRALIRFLEDQPLPLTVSLSKGGKRSFRQNKLQRLWVNEISEQLGDQTPEEVRGYIKLTIGVPILRAENDAFRERYDAIVRPLPYDQKLALMMEPLDFPITRLMTTKQATAYLDGVHRHFSEKGLVLSDPGDLLTAADRQAA